MKILFIPDIHGTTHWEKVINTDIFDKIVFLGDYMDSFTITIERQQENLINIIYFAANNPDKVILLAGNHDNHYIYYHTTVHPETKCSGFSASAAWKNKELFISNLRHFRAAWEFKNILATHAGITNNYFMQYISPFWDKSNSISDHINEMWYKRDTRVFAIGPERGGSDKYGGPFWADIEELKKDPLLNYTQVVGHTAVNDITQVVYNDETKVTFCDCVEHYHKNFYVVNT